MEVLDKIIGVISSLSAPATIGVVAVVLEAGLRLFKTEKPRSILYVIADVANKVGSILTGIGGFLDKAVQRVK